MDEVLAAFKKAFEADDVAAFAGLLERFPQVRAKINDPVSAFNSPLITRVRSRAMLDLLLSAGADINAKSQWWAGGFGILHGADPALARYAIERGATIDIHAAARLGMTDKVRELLSQDPALVRARGGDGQFPLHFANTIEIAQLLLDHGAEIDARDIDHESTAAQYMLRDRQEVARYLVDRGCGVDLLMAAALGDLDRVKQQLAADPSRIRMSVSERYFPKKNPHSGGTIYIWTLGANKNAHRVARDFGHEPVFRHLMEQSPDELKLAVACESGDEAAVEKLLSKHPALVGHLTEEDRRKVVDATQDNDAGAVGRMLAAGWPTDARGQHGGTALHWASFHGNAQLTEIILKHAPPLEWLDHDFQATPLGWAVHGSEHGWYCRTGDYGETVKALLRAGAKPPQKIEGSSAVRDILRRANVPE